MKKSILIIAKHQLLVIFFLLLIFPSCDNRLPWEKKQDELITFDKEKEIDAITNLLKANNIPIKGRKPTGKFYAFEKKCNECSIVSSIDINLSLENDSILAFSKDSIASFVLFFHNSNTPLNLLTGSTDIFNGDLSSLEDREDHCKIFYINPKTYLIEYVQSISGKYFVTKYRGRHGGLFEKIESPIHLGAVMSAIKEGKM